MSLDFSHKTAVVTGGANGIGLACCRALAAGGASVWILDLSRERPQEIAASFGGHGYVTDVTDPESLRGAFTATGAPDILIANAGAVYFQDFATTTRQQWDHTLAVNLSGVFHTIQIAAELMKPRRRGSIVITASTNSYDGEAGLLAYNATKAGLLGILHTAANELGPYQIRVNAVCPGLIRTRLTTEMFGSPELTKDYFRHVPLGRGGEPEEVANAAAFLASNLASFTTGATLFVDGGQMAAKYGTWNESMGVFEKDHWTLKPD